MKELKSILAATDFSSNAQDAALRAAIICKTMEIPLGCVMHVIESLWLDNFRHIMGLSSETEKSILDIAPNQLDELIDQVSKQTGFALEPRVAVGKTIEQILAASAEFDLLVLGARGNHRLRDFAIGTTAERLLRQSRKPILIVKYRPETAYRRILVATDFSPHAQRALAYSKAIASDAEIHLVHVFEAFYESQLLYAGITDEVISGYRIKARNEAEASMDKFIKSTVLNTSKLYRSIAHGGHIPTVLQDKATAIGADLVVVGRHGKSLAEHLLLGSVTLHMLAECQSDILVTQ